MITPDVLEYYRRTAHLSLRAGYPLRRRATIAERIASGADDRLRYLVRGAFLADVYRTGN